MRRGGRSALFAIGIWSLAAVLLTGAVVFGRGVFAQLPEEHWPSRSPSPGARSWLRWPTP
jgi:hypothetical protein